jgi:hypothetical protein
MHFNRARCPIEVVASRLELNAFISHQGLSGQVTRNFSEILRATARTNYRKPNDGFLHGHAPKIVAFLPRETVIRIYGQGGLLSTSAIFLGGGIQYSGNLITCRRQRRRCNKLTTGHTRARRQSVFHCLTPRPVDIDFIVRRNQNCAP